MRVLIPGSRGMLGRDLCATAPGSFELLTPSSSELDITNAAAVRRAVTTHAPDLVINAAAYTQVDRAESDLAIASRVNSGGPRTLGAACAAQQIPIVQFSTDYVFAGDSNRPYREEDPAAPINAYGRTKLAGELAVLASGSPSLVIRTAWLFGAGGRSFPRTMWERATRRLPTRAVDDQWGRPTSARDLARATWELIAAGAQGIVHVSNSGAATTWFEVAQEIFDRAGVLPLLEACRTSDFPTDAKRPRYSVLDTRRLCSLLGRELPAWRESLSLFLRRLEQSGTLD